MGRDEADDTARFMQAIAAFSAAPEPNTPHGRLIASSAQTVVQSILTEITETVLRRTLCFMSRQGLLLSLDVTERRILRISGLSEALGSESKVINRDLTPEDAGDVLKLLHCIADDTQEIYVIVRLPETPTPSTFTGVSVRDLRAADDDTPASDHKPDPLAIVLEACRENASGILLDHAGQELTRFGATNDGDELAKLSERHGPELFASGSVRLWQAAENPGGAVIAAKIGNRIVWLLTSQAHMLTFFELMHGIAISDAA